MNCKIRSVIIATIWVVITTTPAIAGSYLRVISWNTLHMGWSAQTDYYGYAKQMWRDFGATTSAGNGLDVAFLQEVMYDTSLPKLVDALETVSGKTWDYIVTERIGRSSYKERYAVVYRADRVEILYDYVYDDLLDDFAREPHVVCLEHKQTGADYTFINWHTIWGTAVQRRAEIGAITDVFNDVQDEVSWDQDVILLGDHNRDANSNYWDELTDSNNVFPSVDYAVNTDTTINRRCSYSSAYDHFWFQPVHVTEFSSAGVDYIGNSCDFRKNLSDHAPIWLKLYSITDTD